MARASKRKVMCMHRTCMAEAELLALPKAVCIYYCPRHAKTARAAIYRAERLLNWLRTGG